MNMKTNLCITTYLSPYYIKVPGNIIISTKHLF